MKWDKIAAFVLDDSKLTTEQLMAELNEQGVDANAFLKRIEETVQRGNQYQIQQKAAAESRSRERSIKR